MRISRRAVLAGVSASLLARPAAAQQLAYAITPEPIGDGVWMVRGADAPILRDNGGAIANLTILATDAGTVLVDCGPSLRYGEALRGVVARLTGAPVTRILFTHFHPDHGFAAAAFPQAQLSTTPIAAREIEANGPGLSDGMYRLLGDWMRGTEVTVPKGDVAEGPVTIGGRTLRLLPMAGHSKSDLAILDEASGVLIAGDLVFHDRAPSTPDADLPVWRESLDRMKALGHRSLLPGHGPYDRTPAAAIDQTRDWIDWLDGALRDAVAGGRDMVEAGAMPIPDRFTRMAAARYELQRSVSHFYARLETEMFERIDRPQ